MSLLDNLKDKPYEVRVWATLVITGIAAIVLIPLWVWHLKSVGLKPEGPANTGSVQTSVDNAVPTIDEQLTAKFASPVAVSTIDSTGSELVVNFTVNNSTFADLEFPATALIAKSGSPLYSVAQFKKITDMNGAEFPVLIARGTEVRGKMYFAKVANGSYVITISNLRYSADNQTPFEQVIPIEVTSALTPRS